MRKFDSCLRGIWASRSFIFVFFFVSIFLSILCLAGYYHYCYHSLLGSPIVIAFEKCFFDNAGVGLSMVHEGGNFFNVTCFGSNESSEFVGSVVEISSNV